MIAEDTITAYLNGLLGQSKSGADLHHLLIAAAKRGHRSPLGHVEDDKLEVSMYAIAPVAPEENPEAFIAKVIISAGIEAYSKGREIHFAGLAIEAHVVVMKPGVDEATENRARRFQGDGKLREHPDAVEATRVYAACSDGRRWVGEHYLTGPKAGTIDGPMLCVGGLVEQERGTHARLIRKLVQGPAPMRVECRLGYTWRQVEAMMGPRLFEFSEWIAGQTVGICDGRPPCDEPHGPIVYSDDITRFLGGGRVVD